jgi:hypothetical protein
MTVFLSGAGLLFLALIAACCLWPPRASGVTTLVLSLGVVLVVTVLAITIGFIIIVATAAAAVLIIVVTAAGAVLVGAGLPIPEWPREAVTRAKTLLLRNFRHGA